MRRTVPHPLLPHLASMLAIALVAIAPLGGCSAPSSAGGRCADQDCDAESGDFDAASDAAGDATADAGDADDGTAFDAGDVEFDAADGGDDHDGRADADSDSDDATEDAVIAPDGDTTGADADPEVGDAADDGADGDAESDTPGDDADDVSDDAGDTTGDLIEPECDGAPGNACGGCATLASAPGTPCGTCADGRWTCDGDDAVSCVGASLRPRSWWRDVDGDGYGERGSLPRDACLAPVGWVDDASDCDDDDPNVSPEGVETCDGRDEDCDDAVDESPAAACLDACCDDSLVCEAGRCRASCSVGAERCGTAPEFCCDIGDICYAGTCAAPGEPCRFTEDCGLDEICEPELGLCLPRALVPPCEFIPPVGVFSPTIGCRWTPAGLSTDPARDDVVATPIVINLTDDDGDGDTDAEDDPEVVFLTYELERGCCNVAATLRIISGVCNADGTANTRGSINSPELNNDTGIAAGDLDGDGVPEIVAVTRISGSPRGTVAFRRTSDDASSWEVAWQNTSYPSSSHTRGGATISLADLDADGTPEVVIGNVVLDGVTGALEWDGNVTSGGRGGIGNNAFLGPTSAVGDVNLDGFQEVAAGNTLYAHDGTVLWTYSYTTSNSACGGSLPCDGFDALANFDADPQAEIVAVRRGEVFIWNHDGTLLWQAQIPVDDCGNNESGPPTVADFDGDGEPEIGTASADFYVVLDPGDCGDDWAANGCDRRNIRWKVPNQDCSSRATGSSVFDFEGDGRAEVIYADEVSFRIFDGRTGAILFDDQTHGSHTRIEMPVIADVDNDGNAEIVIPENGSNGGTPGVEIWDDAADNWVRTRRVWNQHGYSVTNIREDGTIPRVPETNWLNPRMNHWRQNTQPAGIFDAPDLVVLALDAAADACPIAAVDVVVTVENQGALSVPAGAAVEVTLVAGAETRRLGTLTTSRRLFPGDEETIEAHLVIDSPPEPPYDVLATVDPDERINECDETNNAREAFGVSCYPWP
ncbi:MAG: hypothetical protein H6698_00595 [Myxococcales bacterium]|nr:hypothetical protein [Myxococcales bacterium]MCB9531977.1 hypothetical protein [Myxococcales bacterium]MCB9532810.1 hypothetical protein [Myxococcales bacterium]